MFPDLWSRRPSPPARWRLHFPHGGIAFGLDRLPMVLTGAESIREVIAFPKTQRGQDLMTKAPSDVAPDQLRDLRIPIDLS